MGARNHNHEIRYRRLPAVAGMLAMSVCALSFGVDAAAASSSVHLKESGSLRRVGKAHGFDLAEKGSAGGTIKGTIALQLHVTSTDKVTATVEVYPHGGSLSGSGAAAYHVHGSYAEFSGTLSITKGSGSWKGAHASALRFTGKIKRASDAVSVELSGTLYR